jgi:ubiquinone biosynthesis protein COQ9
MGSMELVKSRLLRASLDQVSIHGWTTDAIIAAVEHEKLPLSTIGMITPKHLVEWFMQDCNQRFARALDGVSTSAANTSEFAQSQQQEHLKHEGSQLNVEEDLISNAIQMRLELVIPILPTWHQAMALGAIENPITTAHQVDEIVTLILMQLHGNNNATTNNTTTTTTADTSWKAVTVSLPTLDRAAITGIYIATELHLLTDTSENYEDTWIFLRGKVKDWYSNCNSTARQSPSNSNYTSDTIVAAMAVASSLAGGFVSLAPSLTRAFMQTAVPNLLASTMTGIISSSLKNSSVSYSGGSPNDYSDLPPFPTEDNAPKNNAEKW